VRGICLFVALTGSVGFARAESDAAALVARLTHGDFKERQLAGKALEALGDRAVSALRDAIRTGDLEARRRAESILRKIVAQRMRKALADPRFAEFHFMNAPLAEVEREVQRLFGGDIRLAPENLPRKSVTAEVSKRPLWLALEALSRQSGLSFTPHHAYLGYPPNAAPLAFLTPLDNWTLDVKPANNYVRWADRSSSIAFLARQPSNKSLEILAIPDPRLHALRGIQSLVLTQWRDRAGKDIAVQDAFTLAELGQEPPASGVKDQERSLPPTMWHAVFTAKAPLDFDSMRGIATCRVRSVDDVLAVKQLVKSEGKAIHEPKTGVCITIHEVDFVEETELRVKLQVQYYDRYIRLPDAPEVIRLKPGVLAVRGPADYVAESVHVTDSHGAAHGGRLLEQPRNDKDGLHLWMQFTIPPRSRAELGLLLANARNDLIEVPFTLRPVD
jgi:hypothetical protein